MRRRPPRTWRYLLWDATAAGVLAVVGSLGVGWFFSEKLLKPNPSSRPGYDVEVLDSEAGKVKLSPNANARRSGTYGLKWAGGYGQVGRILYIDESGLTREFRAMRGAPEPGNALLDSYAFPHDPERAFGLQYEEITVNSELGELPAWYIEGT